MTLLITCQFNPVWLTFSPQVFRSNGNEIIYCLTFKHLLDSVSFFSNSMVARHFYMPSSNINQTSVSLNSSDTQKLFTLSIMKMCKKQLRESSDKIKNNLSLLYIEHPHLYFNLIHFPIYQETSLGKIERENILITLILFFLIEHRLIWLLANEE